MLEPVQIAEKLELLEKDLEIRQTPLAEAAHAFYVAKREQEKAQAKIFLTAAGSVEARRAESIIKTEGFAEAEAVFEARKRAINVIEARASILQTLAKVGR